MSDDQHTDESAEQQPAEPEQAAEASKEEPADEKKGRPGHEGHSVGREIREGAAKVWGYTVEVSSMLAGQGGDVVEAEREVAEKDAEDFFEGSNGKKE